MNWKKSNHPLPKWALSNFYEGSLDGVLELPGKPHRKLLIWHPEGIDWIFRNDQRLRPCTSRTLTHLLGRRSLLWAEGPRHAAYRRLLGPSMRGHQLQPYCEIISKTVHAKIDALATGTGVSLISWLRRVALSIISQIILNRADDLLIEALTNRIESVLGSRTRTLAHRCLGRHTSSIFGWRFPGDRFDLDSMLLRYAKATKDARSPALAALLLAGDGLAGSIDDEELRDQVMSLLFAGHETTASATAWTLYWLSRNESVRRDVIAELTTMSNGGSDPAQVPLLHAASQESLRLSPPAIVAGKRMLTTHGELLGKPVASGTIVTPCIYLAHHQPDIFPNPHRFDPTRFIGNQFPRRHYFPFGGGTRHCLGSELAMLEIRMIVAAVLDRCVLHYVGPRTDPTVNPAVDAAELRGPTLTLTHRLQISAAGSHRKAPQKI